MSANDVLQLDTHFQKWKRNRAEGLNVEPFFYYAAENILKIFNWSDEDLRYGLTDRGNDGGVDAFYFVANKNTLVRDDAETAKHVQSVRIIIIQVKSSASDTGFKPGDVIKFEKFTEDLLDLPKKVSDLKHKYQPHLLTLMGTFKEKFLEMSVDMPDVQIHYYLVTRGDDEIITPSVADEIEVLRKTVAKHLKADFCFHEVDTQRLLEFVSSRRPTVRALKWRQTPLQVEDKHIGLVRLRDYRDFLKDKDGDLDESVFEANVRGYQQDTPVNVQIRGTLADSENLDFWLLNNGVTIVSDGEVQPLSATGLRIESPQIVNGLQTSREIFSYYSKPENENNTDDRAVLVRVIPVTSPKSRDEIIRATNSQNKMNSASLRATDEIHRAIEVLFEENNLYYDRRRGFYKDQGKPITRIVSVLELIQALVAILLGRPDSARARPGDFLKKDKEYQKLFGKDQIKLGAYLKCLNIMRRVEAFYASLETDKADVRNIEFYVAYCLVCDIVKSAQVTDDAILNVSSDGITEAQLDAAHATVWDEYAMTPMGQSSDALAKGPDLLKSLRAKVEAKYGQTPSVATKVPKKMKVRDVLKQNAGAGK